MMTDKLCDLYLHFTGKADALGDPIYEVYQDCDRLTMRNPLGEHVVRAPVEHTQLGPEHVVQTDTWDPAEPYHDEPGFGTRKDEDCVDCPNVGKPGAYCHVCIRTGSSVQGAGTG